MWRCVAMPLQNHRICTYNRLTFICSRDSVPNYSTLRWIKITCCSAVLWKFLLSPKPHGKEWMHANIRVNDSNGYFRSIMQIFYRPGWSVALHNHQMTVPIWLTIMGKMKCIQSLRIGDMVHFNSDFQIFRFNWNFNKLSKFLLLNPFFWFSGCNGLAW